ncbi:hypothetical protein AB834_03035 [PVC group bacterium (ex Bugula neritina AB1)]|nr:hypothetical protein AB834_03035 [PVC group bacterium (ex Bugula neritina AB1)]
MTSLVGSEFLPSLVLVQKEALQYTYAQEMIERLKHYDPEYITVKDDAEARELLNKSTRKKKHIYLYVNKGSFIRKKNFGQDCINTDKAYCLDHVIGCQFACVYCYLHSYLKDEPLVKVAVNIDDMFEELENITQDQEPFFISTGELSDSLLFEPITNLTTYLYDFLKTRPQVTLELRSKSRYTSFLENIKPLPNMYLTWSLSPPEVVKKYELKTASFEERVQALKKCQEKGFSIGIIMDPMIHYDDWKKGYTEMVDSLASQVDLTKVQRIFVGSFRYMKGMDRDIQNIFSKTDLFSSEFVLARDGKYRYYKPLREKMYRLVIDRLAFYQKKVSLSMEFPETWSKLLDG